MSIRLANRMSLKGKPTQLTVCGINQQKTIDTEAVDVTIKPIGEDTCAPFAASPYFREEFNTGPDIVDVPRLQA